MFDFKILPIPILSTGLLRRKDGIRIEFDWAHAATHVMIDTCVKRLDEDPIFRSCVIDSASNRLNRQVFPGNSVAARKILKIKALL